MGNRARVVPAKTKDGKAWGWAVKQGNLVLAVHKDKALMERAADSFNVTEDAGAVEDSDILKTHAMKNILEVLSYEEAR